MNLYDLKQILMRTSTTQKYEWRDDALCKNLDTSVFFPDLTGVNIDLYIKKNMPCGQCMVKKACKDYADDHGEEYGIWGGEYRSPYLLKNKANGK